mmetsp:Transcript_15687/g.51469  ORF Transcript_15687/g.51469 Transcript_15687/m.51469 type:complete len:476 (-) Transcript_15687:476-1903(-)
MVDVHVGVGAQEIAHHHEAHLGTFVRLDAVQPEKLCQERVAVLRHVLVVSREERSQVLHFVLAHRLDDEAVVVREVEDSAALSRRRNLTERLVAAEAAEVVSGVDPPPLAQLAKHHSVVVLELEVAARGVRGRRGRAARRKRLRKVAVERLFVKVLRPNLARRLRSDAADGPADPELQLEHEVVRAVAFVDGFALLDFALLHHRAVTLELRRLRRHAHLHREHLLPHKPPALVLSNEPRVVVRRVCRFGRRLRSPRRTAGARAFVLRLGTLAQHLWPLLVAAHLALALLLLPLCDAEELALRSAAAVLSLPSVVVRTRLAVSCRERKAAAGIRRRGRLLASVSASASSSASSSSGCTPALRPVRRRDGSAVASGARIRKPARRGFHLGWRLLRNKEAHPILDTSTPVPVVVSPVLPRKDALPILFASDPLSVVALSACPHKRSPTVHLAPNPLPVVHVPVGPLVQSRALREPVAP